MPTVQELFDLHERVAIVTGGAGHLGTAMSEALAEAGAHVVIASRNADNCRALAERLSRDHPRAVGLNADTTDEASLSALVEQVVREFGRVDILVNNAYSARHRKEAESMTVEEFESSLRGNVTSYFCAVKACVPHMRKQGCGAVVNIASMYGMVAPHFHIYRNSGHDSPINYHATKGAVLQMTRYMASYFAKDRIRVNAVSPGAYPKPDILEKSPWFGAELGAQTPMNRIGQPWELKGAVLLLASDAGSYITGQNLVVDGGWTMW